MVNKGEDSEIWNHKVQYLSLARNSGSTLGKTHFFSLRLNLLII